MVALFTLCSEGAFATQHQWQSVSQSRMIDTESEGAEITVSNGYIYVAVPKAMTVKVFSILGHLISQKSLPPGVSRLKIETRGIYIIKIGDKTHRVTI